MKYTCSEYKTAEQILLYCPPAHISNINDVNSAMHIDHIDHTILNNEFNSIRRSLQALNIDIIEIDDTHIPDTSQSYMFNMMYCRDLLFMSPYGAIMANMKYDVRTHEPIYAQRTLEQHNIPVIKTLDKRSFFEGADALWLTENIVIIGVGNRTNDHAFSEIQETLQQYDITCIKVPSYQTRTQHLLGSVQIVDKDLAFVRTDIIDHHIIEMLKKYKYTVIQLNESEEITQRQAMNIVTVAPRTILMTAQCPETRKIYESYGVTVAAEINIDQLIHGAGGLACALNIIARKI